MYGTLLQQSLERHSLVSNNHANHATANRQATCRASYSVLPNIGRRLCPQTSCQISKNASPVRLDRYNACLPPMEGNCSRRSLALGHANVGPRSTVGSRDDFPIEKCPVDNSLSLRIWMVTAHMGKSPKCLSCCSRHYRSPSRSHQSHTYIWWYTSTDPLSGDGHLQQTRACPSGT